jgi:outer membrane receptor for ferrienterochelin and colicins
MIERACPRDGLMRAVLFVLLCGAAPALAQTATTIRVEVRHGAAAVSGASVAIDGRTAAQTDSSGAAVLTVSPGTVTITVVKDGFATATTSVSVAAGQQQSVLFELDAPLEVEETVIVSATRTDKRLEDQPLRVEVLDRDEIVEKMLMTPGDIVMMLNETGGLRVQSTSPSLGAASVRVQGMRGRYTRFLSDGLPLFGEVGGLGLLQIPPMDLGRVEVIKGVASSLYGAGAIGGVVNLLSRRPATEPDRELMLNRSSRGATDAIGYFSAPLSPQWGLTVLGSGHWQELTDIHDDGWADLPEYARGVLRPRIFWDNGSGRTFFATAGMTVENREGGTARGAVLPQTGSPYVEALETRKFDVGAVAQTIVGGRVLSARAAIAQQRHHHVFGEVRERDRHNKAFGELAVRGMAGRHTWVAGAALEVDGYRALDLPRFDYTFTIPGVFAQDDVDVTSWLSLSASGRLDHHSEYGTFLSPRMAVLLRSGPWSSRLSVGTGFYGPSALTEETEAAGLTRLDVLAPLRPERGRSASVDLTRTAGPVSATVTLFASRIRDPIRVEREEAFTLTNAAEPATNAGAEVLGTFRREPLALTVTYAYVRAREFDGTGRLDAALTPRHSAGIVGMWEREDAGRVGVEVYYTGVQRLEANPYARDSEPYLLIGIMAERQFGPVRLFINGENLTDVHQTRWQPLVRPDRGPDGRWTVDAWAPLDGRNVNGGVRVRF